MCVCVCTCVDFSVVIFPPEMVNADEHKAKPQNSRRPIGLYQSRIIQRTHVLQRDRATLPGQL